MKRRDLIKSAIALALYGPRFPALARIPARGSALSSPATQTPSSTPFPRTAIIAIGGDQGYGWQSLGTYLGQVGSNSISSSGYFPSADYVNPIQWIGRFDLAIIGGVWEGWTSSGGRDRADLVEAIKQITLPAGTSSCVFLYNILEQASPTLQNLPYPSWNAVVSQQHWYLYDAGGNPVDSSDQTPYEVNWAVAWPGSVGSTSADNSFVPTRVIAPDGTSEGPTDWAADYFLSLCLIRSAGYTGTASGSIPASSFTDSRWSWPYETDAPNQDGLFLDNLFACPYVGGDYDLQTYYAGNSDAFDTPVCAWLLRGSQHFFARYQTQVQKAYPGRTYYNFGNLSSWQSAYVSGYWNTVSNGIQDTMHGGVLEASIGTSHSIESYKGWYADVNSLQGIVDFCLDPKLVVHATEGGGKGSPNYQLMRYGLTTALMGQAYHSCNLDGSYDYSTALWYDEYGGNPGTNVAKGYLGNPKGSRPTAAAIGPVWVADFDNGVALCYPRTDLSNTAYTQPVTVTAAQINSYLGTNYSLSFIQGVQNPSLNSGQAMTSVTLQTGGDGVILLHGATSGPAAAIVDYGWSGTSGNNVAAQSVTRNVAINKGDLLVAWVMGYGAGYPSSVADGQLGTLATAGSAQAATSYPSFLKTYWAIATQDYAADSSNQVTASFNPAASSINVIWALYRCSAGYVFGSEIASVGAAQNSPGTGAGAINTGAANIGSAPAFLVAGSEILGLGGATPTVYSSGWRQDFSDGTDNFAEASILVTTQGNQECQWTASANSGGADYGNVLAGFSVVTPSAVTMEWSGDSGSSGTTPASSVTLTRSVGAQAGDLLVVWATNSIESGVSSVSDSGSAFGSLTPSAASAWDSADTNWGQLWWKVATQADAGGTITVDFTGSSNYSECVGAIFRATGASFGGSVGAAGQVSAGVPPGGTVSTPSVAPSAYPAFVLAYSQDITGNAGNQAINGGWSAGPTGNLSGSTPYMVSAFTTINSGAAQETWTTQSADGTANYSALLLAIQLLGG